MSNQQPKQTQLNRIDIFSITTGLIGLVADVVSLTSLFAISSSNSTKNAPLHIWFLVLLSIIYSVAAINFYARRYFHKRALANFQAFTVQQVRRIEKATFTCTCLATVPILIGYFIFAFLEIDRLELMLMYTFDPFILADDVLRPILCGIFYGGLLAVCICYLFHYWIVGIYIAFDPLYRPARFN
jgi:hypothetical protein